MRNLNIVVVIVLGVPTTFGGFCSFL